MDNKCTDDGDELKSFKRLQCSKKNKIFVQKDVAFAIDSNDNSEDSDGINEE